MVGWPIGKLALALLGVVVCLWLTTTTRPVTVRPLPYSRATEAAPIVPTGSYVYPLPAPR